MEDNLKTFLLGVLIWVAFFAIAAGIYALMGWNGTGDNACGQNAIVGCEDIPGE